jgi:zeaxanthin glucosyltransferase
MKRLHLACICDPGASHVMNFAAIGRELGRRGHRVTVFQSAQLEPEVSAVGLEFVALRNPASSLEDRDGTEEDGRGSVRKFLHYAIQKATMFCEWAPGAFQSAGIDGVLVDVSEPGGATAAEAAGLPFVTICNTVPLHGEPNVPPDFTGWQYRQAWWAAARNSLAYTLRDIAVWPLHRVLNRYRRKWGLPPYRSPDDSFSPFAQITQLVREFDFPRQHLPDCLHYVGPYRRGTEHDISFPYERLDGSPLIYASLGTVLGIRTDIWNAIIEGCSHANVQLVMSLGGHGRMQRFAGLRANAIVVDYAPQRELLRRASLAISHAGLNSVMEALAAGVPVIAIPMTGDQFAVAARVTYTRVGETIAADKCTGASIAAMSRQILGTPIYRERAHAMRDAIQGTGGAAAAAAIIEGVVATRRALSRDALVRA